MPPRVILHIDLDAFFASVEQRDHPAFRGRPVVVGADPKGGRGRGVVSTCSYEARRFGIHSAMPISQAYLRCPQAVFVRPNMEKYSRVSDQVFEIMNDFTPDIEPVSIDEAFLDITGSFHLFGTPVAAARQLKTRIKTELGLTASVGIAPVKFVAKIASDYSKPDGLLEIVPENVLSFLKPLPVGRLWGVGPKTREVLSRLGIVTIADVAGFSRERLWDSLGEAGLHLHDLAQGIDPREVAASEEAKSVSHEHTFEEDTLDLAQIDAVLLELSEMVSRRLRRHGLKGKTVTLKIRTEGFKTFTRAQTLSGRTNYADEIFETVRSLMKEFLSGPPDVKGKIKGSSNQQKRIRLLGVRVTHFDDPYVQETLFKPEGAVKKEKMYSAIDRIKDKFGEDAIHRARQV